MPISRRSLFTLAIIALCSGAIVSCASGPSSPSGGGTTGGTPSSASPAPNAQVREITMSTSPMTVAAIDPAARTVTLAKSDGAQRIYRCGPQIADFSQIKVGDRVNATISDSVVMFVRHSEDPPYAGEAAPVDAWLAGDQPRPITVNTAEVRARILTVDAGNRTITIESPGEMTTLPVDPGVDLRKFKKGESVVLRVSESLALLVEAARK